MNSVHFDKILLTALVLIFAALAFRGFHLGNGDLATFATDNSKLFSGALLTLITGRALAGIKNGGSNVPPPQDHPVVPDPDKPAV